MRHVHIVEPYNSLAMHRMSQPLIQEFPAKYKVTTSKEVDHSADVNIHCPWHTMVGLESRGKHIIMYTHCNPPDTAALMDACERADLIVCMTYTGRKELVTLGVDPAKLWVIYSAADNFIFSRKIIGLVGFPQPNGRKRESLLLDLAWKYDLTPFQFVLCGDGWEHTVAQLQSLGVKADALTTTEADLQELYQQIDVLLVTGYAEGGPLPILEAMAVGTHVLSPRFGYASDLLDESNYYETPEELMDKLNGLAEKSILNHQLARAWSWFDYAREYDLLISRLLGETPNLYPDFAADRYAQLLDIIDEEKPRGIVEIGTWSGNRALQMIQQAAKYRPVEDIYYQGFDLFETQTGEQFRRELSKHGWSRAVVEKRLKATGAEIELVAGQTDQTLFPSVMFDDKQEAPEFYFVDGGHSEKTISNDAGVVLNALCYPLGAVAIFDDYYHSGKPEGMGCNKVIDALDSNIFEVTHLPVKTITKDGREIGMVKVKRNANIHIQ